MKAYCSGHNHGVGQSFLTMLLAVSLLPAAAFARELRTWGFEEWQVRENLPPGWDASGRMFPAGWRVDLYPENQGFIRRMPVSTDQERFGKNCAFLNGRIFSEEVFTNLLNKTLRVSLWAKGAGGRITARLREYTETSAEAEAFLAEPLVETTSDQWNEYSGEAVMMPNWAPSCVRLELDGNGVLVDQVRLSVVDDDPQAAKANIQQVHGIPLVKSAPTIDGKVSAGEWQDAVGMKNGFMQMSVQRAVSRQTEYRLVSDGAKLFVLFKVALEGQELKANQKQRDSNVWEDDSVEVYINPTFDQTVSPAVYHFIVNSAGALYDESMAPGQSDPKWNCPGAAVAASVEKGQWTTEMAIPLVEVGLKPGAGFGLNLARNLRSPIQMTCVTGAAYNNFKKMIGCTISEEAPSVFWEYSGAMTEGRLALTARIGNPGLIPVARQVTLTVQSDQQSEEKQTLSLNPGAVKDLSLETRTSRGSAAILSLEVADGKGKTFFSQTVQWDPSQDQVAKTAPRPAAGDCRMEFYPEQKKINFRLADVVDGKIASGQALGRAEIFISKNDSIIDHRSIEKPLLVPETKSAHYTIPFAPPDMDVYQVKAVIQGQDGTPLRIISEPVQTQTTPWLGNRIGKDRVVPPPFEAVQVKDHSLGCWGRTYQLARNGFPEQIRSQGEQVLGGPIELVLDDGAGPQPGKGGQLRFEERRDDRVIFTGKTIFPKLTAEVRGTLEYDGVIKYELELVPKDKPEIKGLSLRIPFRGLRYCEPTRGAAYNSMVRMQELPPDGVYRDPKVPLWTANHRYPADTDPFIPRSLYLPRQDGLVWTSNCMQLPGIAGDFIPHLWLGNTRYGLSWFADDDRGWSNDPEHSSYHLYKHGDTHELRIDFITKPTRLTGPRKIVFGLLATPVRPGLTGANAALRYGTHGFANAFVKRWPAFEYKDYWLAKRHNDRFWRKNNGTAFIYTAQDQMSTGEPSCAYLRPEWEMEPFGGWNQDLSQIKYKMYGPKPEDYLGHSSCIHESRNDYWLYFINQAMARGVIDGVYLDNSQLMSCINIQHPECARIREDGRLSGGFHLFGFRELTKRLAVAAHQNGLRPPNIGVHLTANMNIPSVTFADYRLDGEWRQMDPRWGGITPDFMDYYPLPYVEAFCAGAWGLTPAWLPQLPWDETPYPTRHLLAVIKLFDVWIYPAYCNVPLLQKLTRIEREFGTPESGCRFVGYWEEESGAIAGRPNTVPASFFVRPGKGALVYLSNLAKEKASVTCRMNLAKWNLPVNRVVDAEDNRPVALKDGQIAIDIAGHDFRLLRMEP